MVDNPSIVGGDVRGRPRDCGNMVSHVASKRCTGRVASRATCAMRSVVPTYGRG